MLIQKNLSSGLTCQWFGLVIVFSMKKMQDMKIMKRHSKKCKKNKRHPKNEIVWKNMIKYDKMRKTTIENNMIHKHVKNKKSHYRMTSWNPIPNMNCIAVELETNTLNHWNWECPIFRKTHTPLLAKVYQADFTYIHIHIRIHLHIHIHIYIYVYFIYIYIYIYIYIHTYLCTYTYVYKLTNQSTAF